MGQYDSPRRSLPWDLLHPLTTHRTTEDDGPDCEPSSFVWPLDSDERVLVPFMLSLNEYNVLATTIDVGSDIAYGEDALRVTWLWLRNMRCPVDLCALIAQCIEDNPAITEIIAQQLIENETFNEWVETMIDTFAPEATGGNQYDAWPTAATPDPLCNAATYVVAKIRELIVGVYDDLETLTPQEVFEALLGLFGWRSGPLYQLIGLLETADRTALLAAYDAAAPDLICELIAAELDQEPIITWIETTYPAPSVLGDAMKLAVQSAAGEGKYSQWIAVGATMTDATCDCEEPPGTWCRTWNFEETDGSTEGITPNIDVPGISFTGFVWSPGVGLINSGTTDGDRTFGQINFPSPTLILSATMTWTYVDPASSGNIWLDHDFGVANPVSPPTVSHGEEYTEPISNLIFGGDKAGSDVSPFIVIKSLTLSGDGTIPPQFGESNC